LAKPSLLLLGLCGTIFCPIVALVNSTLFSTAQLKIFCYNNINYYVEGERIFSIFM